MASQFITLKEFDAILTKKREFLEKRVNAKSLFPYGNWALHNFRKDIARKYLNELQFLSLLTENKEYDNSIKIVTRKSFDEIIENARDADYYVNVDIGDFTGTAFINGHYYVWLAPLSIFSVTTIV